MSNGDRNITWLPPLFTNGGGADIVVGVTQDRAWFLQLDPPLEICPDTIHPAIVPLVQPGYGGDFATAHALIADRLATVGLDATLVDSFPYDFPVRTSFGMSGFWMEHALQWLPHIAFTESFARELLRRSLDSQVSQPMRHEFARHVRRWESDNGVTFVRPTT